MGGTEIICLRDVALLILNFQTVWDVALLILFFKTVWDTIGLIRRLLGGVKRGFLGFRDILGLGLLSAWAKWVLSKGFRDIESFGILGF